MRKSSFQSSVQNRLFHVKGNNAQQLLCVLWRTDAAGRFDLYYGEVRLTADWDVSSLLATGSSLNYGGWSDPQCDQLLEGCRSGGNREAAFRGLCRDLQSQAPILPICFKTVSTLYESDVLEGLTPTAAEPFYRLENISIHLRAN